jgi:hypothetical protein
MLPDAGTTVMCRIRVEEVQVGARGGDMEQKAAKAEAEAEEEAEEGEEGEEEEKKEQVQEEQEVGLRWRLCAN